MPKDSVDAECGGSCENNQGGKDGSMSHDSVGAEDGDSFEYDQGG